MSFEVTLKVRRYSKEKGSWWQEYKLNVDRFTTVIEALRRIKTEQDPTLSFRASCHMGVCGSCGMKINGKPKLACKTLIVNEGKKEITIEPMDNFPVIKDLIVDLDSVYRKMNKIIPRVTPPEEVIQGKAETRLKPEDQKELWSFAQCIICGLCYSACPVVETNKDFLGPAVLAMAYRFSADPRDTLGKKRLEIVDDPIIGIWNCRVAGSCSVVCPRNVDPSLAIQRLKEMSMK
ncbi:succinate dehydrogenase/fumarate reductase iron-sulfur subunit [Acidianus ambivalens]|uniref:succinate dehydrogenase n=1 Tax=Acidianus ambivalens TaxID=2283 RepID=A0A650CVN4_ACIAM|nr:succinate dehydrogenase/fumarate reductase iron-sulfur subunit [Acidianus ambivalens]MQL56557.1 succinate dehydrogenase/fumarate reductase iron-sulfur subunit [Acidianus ambivalens]QGR21919.1 succinate dehydrogenase/fumarate reductase iron-sulfur subunit [Acidianus ambivalens]